MKDVRCAWLGDVDVVDLIARAMAFGSYLGFLEGMELDGESADRNKANNVKRSRRAAAKSWEAYAPLARDYLEHGNEFSEYAVKLKRNKCSV